ncbi:hypothetical protein PC9H_002378 [Pleurotus ostreatus]|uniref:Glycosyltransferase 2-like domain-containing protein n=1 Tax=Pleurotus ostreatus TaxID=5322 RepID=A0A8H6ZKL6_PLEOS|nr:uncharacterized protein PC9H_002378 [Pleurotus ostreatus]KAF7416118.1 hypothetical protein PC9H_002378 [Pleurotus ostreatus]
MDYDAFDAILHHLFKTTQGDAWFKPSEENISAGVCIRVEPGNFRVFPYENRYLEPFEAAVKVLNPVVAIKVRSAAVHAALATCAEDAAAIYVDAGTRIQIIESMVQLPYADKEQCGAFIRDEKVLVVWSDDLDTIIPLYADFEDKLIKLVWRSRSIVAPSDGASAITSVPPSTVASNVNLNEKTNAAAVAVSEAAAQVTLAEREKPKPKSSWSFGWKVSSKKSGAANNDVEKASLGTPRPIRLLAPMYSGLGVALSLFFLASGLSVLLQEWRLDGNTKRFALLATLPFLFCVSLFFSLQIITNISFLIGPVAQYHENSRYYSAIAPAPSPEVDAHLPHVTIELPVYKESLEETIAPSVFSLKKAMQTYARQGGTSSILVHDDGLQLIDDAERQKRIAFYANHNIGWVARPPHSNAPDGFKRAGRFKKASNMNYGLRLSLKLEKHLQALEAAFKGIETIDGKSLEEKALDMAVEEMFQETGNRFRPWACNAKSLRIGEIILIIDSDTIVPEDCFRDAARELAECPEVAIIQHESDVMQVAYNYFENGITHFTRRINKSISMGCANGEVAPFVGHNAFLRWSAIQDAAFVDTDGVKKLWSEANVSEDFDMALRLMLRGYIIRWATYSDGGFKEGVSLTVDDELNRWQKYSYGCNELIFNPLIHWWRLGPINHQLASFMWSPVPVHYKVGMMAYMFSYYGIAAGAALSVLNYILLGFEFGVDGFFMHSFEIWLACTVVFPGAGNVAFTLLQYRLGLRSIWSGTKENLTWVPFFFFFFGGLSIHLSTALLAHLFSYNIQWGATPYPRVKSKLTSYTYTVERSNFFIEVPKILKRFGLAFILCFIVLIAMIVLTTDAVPVVWQVPGWSWAVILPLAIVLGCHILFPIVLNPWLMIFSY